MSLKIFLDTEFTNFNNPKLISLGLITEDGSKSFYAELTDSYVFADCSDFVNKRVSPLLDGEPITPPLNYFKIYAKMTTPECREQLLQWFERINFEIIVVNDAPSFDWVLLKELFGDHWPKNLDRKCYKIVSGSLAAEQKYQHSMIQAYKDGYRQHHALDDATVMALCWLT